MQIMDSHMRAALEMPPEVGQRFLKALTAYVTEGEEPDFSSPEDWPLRAVWTAIAPVLENSKDISAKRSQAGRRGAEARERARSAKSATVDAETCNQDANANAEEAACDSMYAKRSKRDASASKPQANGSKRDASASGREEEEEEEREVEKKGQGHVRAQARFSPPSPPEVDAYAAEAGISLDSCAFVDYYASKGWRVGSQPMRDWRAAARNWARRDRDGSKVVPFNGRQRSMQAVSDDVLAAYL